MLDNKETKLQAEVSIFSKIPAVDSILEVICRITGMGFAAVARVTEERWIACAVKDNIGFGLLPGGELDIKTTICHEIEQNKHTVVIDHVAVDEQYSAHHTPLIYGFQSYISTPITLSGNRFFGTLCAIDPNPANLNTPETVGMFKLFADLIAFHLNALEQIELSTINLLEEQKTSELRDQFIAILGHDLRNPVGAIRNSAQLLLRMPLDERALRLANLIQDSSYRITGLIENVLDFARGRLGEGITLNLTEKAPLESALGQVVTELKAIWPGRSIDIEFKLREDVKCDAVRIAQLFSNILGNALTYGRADQPVTVKVKSDNGTLVISVANCGDKIPDSKIARLFQPFSRGSEENKKDGLGLGLYIASEIARAHRGTLDVVSTDQQTCFTLTIDMLAL
jgi:signal transduction histidine kinase